MKLEPKSLRSALLALCLLAAIVPPAPAGPQSPAQAGTQNDYTFPPQISAQIGQCNKDTKAGQAALRAGDYVTAESAYRTAISEGPFSPSGDLYYGLAVALTGQGRDAEALQTYHYLFYELPIKSCVSSDILSVVQAYQEQFAQKLYASQTPYTYLGAAPPDAWMRYALLLSQAGQWAEAVRFYEGALPSLPRMDVRLDVHFTPGLPQPEALQSAAHVALGILANFCYGPFGADLDYNRVLSEFGQAVQLAPDSDVANYYYGYGLRMVGRTAQAQMAFAKTVKLGKGGVKEAARRALASCKKPA